MFTLQNEVERLITELTPLRDRYSQLDLDSRSADAMSIKVAKDLNRKVMSYNSYVEELRSRRDKLIGQNTHIALMSVADGADIRLQKLWIDLKQLV